MPINVAINGAAGRMGRMLIHAIDGETDLSLVLALERPDSVLLGQDAGLVAGIGEIGVPVATNMKAASFDVLIDFSVPAATLGLLETGAVEGCGMVIGTTGFNAAGLRAIDVAAETVPIVMAPNMSVGVNVAFRLIETAAKILGGTVDIEIYEMHHRHKIDAPSGTAVRMGEIVANARGRDLEEDAIYGRVGDTGERTQPTIGFHSARGGDVVGEHTVTFAGTGERIEITHKAQSRSNFAAGAIRAVRFIAEKIALKEKGLYGMENVLGL
ncbi:MAG TPA: 4-hydroxy-tetrahydrodipicolinate reductase [Gammaproteobacteria bacterium]|nr:4-hydroxy-tetrahydrodipicolinate reductase [Pseudomonadota bacterium]HBP14700.1 4-hydroxy-tetrahydrodipicolinate reductase [Gammaproteobacteria bacterium]